jgi:hypothetical protein
MRRKKMDTKKKYTAPHLEEITAKSIKGASATCGHYCGYSPGSSCKTIGGSCTPATQD